MKDNTFKNKIILKNTTYLFIRFGIVVVANLLISRVVLNTLGIQDFGIFSLITGFVLFFTFFGAALTNSTQRFFSYELGKGNIILLKKIFGLSLLTFFIISILVTIILETIGVATIKNILIIPDARLNYALIAFHFSCLSIFVSINSYVFQAILIARENMRVYSYSGLLETAFRLLSAYILIFSPFDKLITYSLMYSLASILANIFMMLYCFIKYEECGFSFFWERKLFKKLFSFIGWNSLIGLTEILNQQGISVILNHFFGTAINASRGVSIQISNLISNFTHNIYMAYRPQLIKSYAEGNTIFFLNLITRSSKFNYYLIYVIGLPIILSMDWLLKTWLNVVPPYTKEISILIIIYFFIDSLRNPLWACAQAVGDIKKYSIYTSLVSIIALPIGYLILLFYKKADLLFWVLIIVRLLYMIVVLLIVQTKVKEFKISEYIKEVITPILAVTLTTLVVPILISNYFEGFMAVVVITLTTIFSCAFSVYFMGSNSQERKMIVSLVNKFKLSKS